MSLYNRSKPAFFSAFLKAMKLQQKGLSESAIQYYTVALRAIEDHAHLFKAECYWNLAVCVSTEGSSEDAAMHYYSAGIEFQKIGNAHRAIAAFNGAIQALELQEETEHLQLQIAECSYNILQLLKKEEDKNWKMIAEHLLKINYATPEGLEHIDGFCLGTVCQDAADQYLLEDQFDEAIMYYGVAKEFYDHHSKMLKVEECEKQIENAIFLRQLARREAKAMLEDTAKKGGNDSFSSLTALRGTPSTFASTESSAEYSEGHHLHEISINTISCSQ